MIINTTSHIMKNLWTFFLYIFLIFTLIFLILTNGIRIENLQLPKVNMKQLYIKLDKKLIVSVEEVKIDADKKSTTSLSEIKNMSFYLPYMYRLFKSISIQKILYNNEKIHFLYKDEVFYIDSDFLTLDARIKPWEESIEVQIEQITLKDYALNMKGNLSLNLNKKVYDFKGTFETFNIEGGILLRVEKNILYYRLNSKKFKTLKPFMDFLSEKVALEPIIGAWIYKKIIANEYRLNNLEGKFNLITNEFYPKFMKGRASGKNVSVKFDENVPPATISDIEVVLENDVLHFLIKKASYEGKDVSNSKVYIYNLMSVGAGIVVDINANTILDNSIHKVLHAFDIQIPITQLSGKTNSNVKLDIKFLPFGVKSYSGFFELNDSNLSIANVPMYTKKGTIKLENNFVYIQNANLMYNNLFDIYTSGIFNIEKGTYESENQIDSLHVSLGETDLVHVKDFNASSLMRISDEKTLITIPSLGTKIEFLDQNNIISINKLSTLYQHSKIMQNIDFKDGNLTLKTKDFQNFEILANLKEGNFPLRQNSKQIKELNVAIKTDGKSVNILSLDEKVKIDYEDNINIFIKNLDVIFDSSRKTNTSNVKKINIKGENSNIIDTNSTLKILSTKYDLQIDNSNIEFNNSFQKQKIAFKQNINNIYLSSENLSSIFINTLLDKNAFENGSFTININGANFKKLDGTFIAKNTTIKGLSLYNNIIAFINTVPSLITLKNPGFNDDGYKVDDGLISFTRDEDILYIHKILLNGLSTNVMGNGTVNLKTKKLNIKLEIEVLKSFSSVVKNIPLVGYIFLGDDGKIHTGINIEGTMDNPIINTNVLLDSASSPINIIKRTIETPFRVFE